MNTYYTNADGTKTDQVNVIMPSNIYTLIDDGGIDSDELPSKESKLTYGTGLRLDGFYGYDTAVKVGTNMLGHILTASIRNNVNSFGGKPASCQLFLPYNESTNAGNNPNPLYYRSNTDMPNYPWSPWRRIAYYDEIEAVVMSILRSKGLIT